MHDAMCRLDTFLNWERPTLTHLMNPVRLAESGVFLYSKDNNLVKCAFCDMIMNGQVDIKGWLNKDQEVINHMYESPNCPLLNGRPTTNVPIDGARFEDMKNAVARFHDNHNPNRWETFEHDPIIVSSERVTRPPIAYPMFSHADARKKSYPFNWPALQRPNHLSQAGFFSARVIGAEDLVRCFSCGGGYSHWQPGDCPWTVHARWFPHCQYLSQIMGHEFIEGVRRMDQEHASALLEGDETLFKKSIQNYGEGSAGIGVSGDDAVAEFRQCFICMDAYRDMTFLPCGHMVACGKCAISLKSFCPICRAPIASMVKSYL